MTITTTERDAAQRILVVEDSRMIQKVIEMCLQRPTRQFDLCDDGLAGLEAAWDTSPDLVILDISLPGIDGWEVLRRLRDNPAGADMVVLILTVDAEDDARLKAEIGGADAFMAKPFRPEDLRAVVSLLVDL